MKIFDARGEIIRTLCGGLLAPAPQSLDLADPLFIADPSGNGGSATLFVNGQPAGVWDARDAKGRLVPEGFYQVQLEQPFSDGTSVVLGTTLRVSYQKAAGASLSASPNLVYAGGTIQLTAAWASVPPPDGIKVRIHSVTGERVRVLTLAGGTAAWDLKNEEGRAVASGVYLIRMEGPDAGPSKNRGKTIKVIILR